MGQTHHFGFIHGKLVVDTEKLSTIIHMVAVLWKLDIYCGLQRILPPGARHKYCRFCLPKYQS